MKKIILILLLSPSFLFSQWVQQNAGTDHSIRKIYFINNQTGWACGSYRTIIKTTNGGTNWFTLTTETATGFVNSIFFVNAMTGWAACAYDSLLKTTNGGYNWSTYWGGTYDYLYDVFFINPQNGWVSCGIGKIRKTTNGGLIWNTYNGVFWGIFDIQFTDENTGWGVGGGQYGVISKTTNGGINWQEQTSGTLNPLWGVSMVSNQTGWAVGGYVYSNVVLKTTNGGLNWSAQSCGLTTGLISVHFINLFTGWASGSYGKIIKTTNSGINWTISETNLSNSFWGIYFTDSLTGWTGGDWGKLYKTTNGGAPIGIKPISSEMPNQFSLYQNYPNPFNPSTRIKFDTPPRPSPKGRESLVRLVIYDILGREIAVLVNEQLKPGTYEVEWDASTYPSGVYFYKLSVGGPETSSGRQFVETKKMVLIK